VTKEKKVLDLVSDVSQIACVQRVDDRNQCASLWRATCRLPTFPHHLGHRAPDTVRIFGTFEERVFPREVTDVVA
jgi:hypothetical protein